MWGAGVHPGGMESGFGLLCSGINCVAIKGENLDLDHWNPLKHGRAEAGPNTTTDGYGVGVLGRSRGTYAD